VALSSWYTGRGHRGGKLCSKVRADGGVSRAVGTGDAGWCRVGWSGGCCCGDVAGVELGDGEEVGGGEVEGEFLGEAGGQAVWRAGGAWVWWRRGCEAVVDGERGEGEGC